MENVKNEVQSGAVPALLQIKKAAGAAAHKIDEWSELRTPEQELESALDYLRVIDRDVRYAEKLLRKRQKRSQKVRRLLRLAQQVLQNREIRVTGARGKTKKASLPGPWLDLTVFAAFVTFGTLNLLVA